jgi:predicted acetyltransferase
MTLPFSRVEVVPALSEDEPVLTNLLELYIHDFSEFLPLDLGPDGRFGYPRLPLYWRESGRHPFLIKTNGKLSGFVFVKKGSELSDDEDIWDMAEFFIVRKYRRQGIGTYVAHEVWRRFPGRWEIRVWEENLSAYHFWRCAVEAFVGKEVSSLLIQKDGKCWHVFSFQSVGA